jgi:hypothetical protein
VVLHGGGWKKLATHGVTREAFNAGVHEACPDATVVNYFGMVEQVGTVYFDCSEGSFHEHELARFTVRSPETLRVADRGLLQTFSTVPRSYPGHSLLTDDVVERVTSCPCGNVAQAFRYIDRRANSPVRGCSNA